MRILWVTFSVVVLDQITKLLIHGFSIPLLGIYVEGFQYGQSIDVIGKFLQFTFVENPGIAFGIDIGVNQKFFLTLFTLLLSIAIFIYLYLHQNDKFIYKFAIALILGGAIGNLIDRMFYGVIFGYGPLFLGKVVDFINVEFPDFSLFGKTFTRFPVFNIADSAVTIGVVLLIFFSGEKRNEQKEEEKEHNEENIDNQINELPENIDLETNEYSQKSDLTDGENN